MKIVQFERLGDPAAVLRIVERDDPTPGPGQVLVRMLRMPINPADLLLVEGRYGARVQKLPGTPGAEGVGEIVSCGEGVSGLTPGARVAPLIGSLWRTLVVCGADQVIRIPDDLDLDQAAMLKANPATAAALLQEAAKWAPGLGIVQNAANSAVGRLLDEFARLSGVPLVNVVRRQDAAEAIRAQNPDASVVVDPGTDPESLRETIRQLHPDLEIGFGIDAIGGQATEALATCLADQGTIANYGRLSGRACQLDPHHLIFRGVSLRGFWLPSWFKAVTPDAAKALYDDLISRVRTGTIRTAVEAVYPLEQVTDAAAHAARPGRTGKVLLSA